MSEVKRYSLYSSRVAGGTTFIESTEQLRKDFPHAKVYVGADDYDAAERRNAELAGVLAGVIGACNMIGTKEALAIAECVEAALNKPEEAKP